MGRITSNQGRPIQGVSQQPDKVRAKGQCTLSENFRPDVVRGLTTRPGTTSSQMIDPSASDASDKWHYYDRGTGEEYFIRIDDAGTVGAWSIDGTEHIVNVADAGATTYLSVTDPRTTLDATTIGDTTFIVNRDKDVLQGTTKSDAATFTGLVYVAFIDYAHRHSIQVVHGGVLKEVAYYEAGNGTDASHNTSVRTDYVADKLHAALGGGSGGGGSAGTWGGLGGVGITDEYNLDLDVNVIAIERKDVTDFDLVVADDANAKNLISVKGSIASTDKLPPRAPDGFIIRIDPPGSNDDDASDYWLKAIPTTDGKVEWNETIAPGLFIDYDLDTMPIQLVRESITLGVATFSLEYGAWAERDVGDDDNNPFPSFVDTDNPLKISTIGIFQNRLFFTSGESVIMTRSNQFYNFFKTTTQAKLETDPVDVFADASQVNIFTATIPFDGDLVFFSSTAQFVLLGDEAVTAENATLRQTTSFESDTGVAPVASGENIFFPYNYGDFTGIREYYTDSIVDTKRARPITDHVNRFVEGRPQIFASSTSLNLLATKTDANDNIIYTYEWLWSGTDKVQSAWGLWDFGEGVVIEDIHFKDTQMYVITSRAEGTFIENIDVGDASEAGIEYPIRLDRKVQATMVWNAGEVRWETADPFASVDKYIGVEGADCSQPGNEVYLERDGAIIWTDDEISDGILDVTIYMGQPYKCKYIPTQPVALDASGEARDIDRLTVGVYIVTYNKTGDLTMTVENQYNQTRTQSFGGRSVGGPNNIVGYAPQVPGKHIMPIRSKSDEYTLLIETDDHRPLEIRDFQFDGTFNPRGKRI